MKARLPIGKELVALNVLRDGGPGMYGLEVVSASRGQLRRGSVYVTLARLQEKGFVESETPVDAVHPGLPRPRYRLTALGERVLRAADAAEGAMGCALTRIGT